MATSMISRGSNLRKYLKFLSQTCARNNQHLAATGQIDEDAHYPKVKPKYPPGEWGAMDSRLAWTWAAEKERIVQCRTYQEKVDVLTEYIYKVWQYRSIDTTPNMLNYKCGVTKTRVIEDTSLPSVYDTIDVEEEFHILKPIIIEVLELAAAMNRQYYKSRQVHQMTKTPGTGVFEMEYVLSRLVVKMLLLNILGSLGGRHEHVLNGRLDEDSTVAAFWIRDGVERFPLKKKVASTYIRQDKGTFVGEQDVDFHIRKDKPLPEFALVTDDVCNDLSYDAKMLDYNPRVLGQFSDHIKRTIDPGYVVGDHCKFTHLNVIFPNNKAMNLVGKYGQECRLDAESGYLLSTGFLTTLAQAHGLGFNQYEELTYPFTTQTILTDGQTYTLSAYQLNTLQMWKDDTANPLQNILWKTPATKLYETNENGQVARFNDNLFRMLLKFFLIEPSDRNGVDLSPNIDSFPTKPDITDRKIFGYVEDKVTYDNVS